MTSPSLPNWQKRDNFSRAAHQRVVENVNALNQLDLRTKPPQGRPIESGVAAVGTPLTGIPFYNGTVWTRAVLPTAIDSSTDVDENIIQEGEPVTLLNLLEVGRDSGTDPWLLNAPSNNRYFLAWKTPHTDSANDGREIWVFQGDWSAPCAEDAPPP